MKNELHIKIQNHKVIMQGSVNAAHPLPDSHHPEIEIVCSDGTKVFFFHNPKFDTWEVKHTCPVAEDGTLFKKEPAINYGDSDEIILLYAISNVVIKFDGAKERMYGTVVLDKDQQKTFNSLVNYLSHHGFICVEDIKNDLRNIIGGMQI